MLAGTRAMKDPRVRLPVEVLHRDEVTAVLLADLVALYDVLMTETRRETRLVEEHLAPFGIFGELRTENLEGDQFPELTASFDHCEKDFGHPAVADFGQ